MSGVLSIFRPRRFATLFGADVQNVRRDPIMMMALVPLFILPVIIRVWSAELDAYGARVFGFADLSFYIIVFTIPLTAILLGWVTGMLLLEDRDDGPLLALEVTPVGKGGFLLYRTSVTAGLTFVTSMILCTVLLADNWGLHLLISLLLAVEAVIVAFIMLAFPKNRVEGLALSKIINLAALAPFLALVPGKAGWLGAMVPTFWVGRLLFVESGSNLLLPGGAALAVHLALLFWFYRQATRRLG